MSKILINAYLADLDRIQKLAGTNTELVTREAFKDLLARDGTELQAAKYDGAA